jgi:hypothetical protein
MEEICSSETSIEFQRTTIRRYFPEDRTLQYYTNVFTDCLINVCSLFRNIKKEKKKKEML